MIFPAAVLHIPPVLATENIVFVSGAFRRTIFVSDLESFVKTGVPVGLLADLLKFSKQNPKTVQGMLKTELPLPVVLTSRLLYTRIGEAILTRATAVVDNNGKLSPISFLRAYPAEEMAVDIPQLLGLLKKASSISELVRFFSDAPLDGLK